MLGVSMSRRCPDQTASEKARKAYVDAALAEKPKAADPVRKPVKAAQSAFDKQRADEARRVAGGFVRGGHR